MTKYTSAKTGEYVGYYPNFPNQFQGFKSHIKINVMKRRAGRFAFVTEEVINLLVDEAVTENTKNPLISHAVNVFDGKLFLIFKYRNGQMGKACLF